MCEVGVFWGRYWCFIMDGLCERIVLMLIVVWCWLEWWRRWMLLCWGRRGCWNEVVLVGLLWGLGLWFVWWSWWFVFRIEFLGRFVCWWWCWVVVFGRLVWRELRLCWWWWLFCKFDFLLWFKVFWLLWLCGWDWGGWVVVWERGVCWFDWWMV